MKLDSMNQLFISELADIYSAEQQLTKALPKLVKAASDKQLKKAFGDHLTETEEHVERLKQIFDQLEIKPPSKTCKAMQGLVEEGSEMAGEDGEPSVIDAGLIAAAQRVEHYEIAAYGCARTYAEALGHSGAASLLEASLDEEKSANEKLTKLAESLINERALQTDGNA